MKDKETVILAMSGGVDSSVTAGILLEQGYNVIGATFNFEIPCSKLAIDDAKIIAKKLGIEHYVIDCKNEFRKNVIDYFTETYVKGETPNPCAQCNRLVKFAQLEKLRKKLKADYIATGHYAKITRKNDVFELHKASDPIKDQSYFLSFLKPEYLPYIKFPLEGMTKTKVREYAKKLGLSVADKPSSQDACFANNDYKAVVNKYRPHSAKKGDIVHIREGKLGEHNGIVNYTIGQRKGLTIGYKKPLYVIKIDAKKNIVYVGDDKDLFSKEIHLYDLNLLDAKIEENKKYEFTIKLRSTHKGEKATVIFDIKNKTAQVLLKKPVRAVTKGQLCAFYDGAKVVGSGWIG